MPTANPGRRQAIMNAFKEELSIDEIALKFKLAVGTVRSYHVTYKQLSGDESVRHSTEKAQQIDRMIGILRATYRRNVTAKVYEPFGGPNGDTTKTYQRAGCEVEFHTHEEGDYKNVTCAKLLANTKHIHILDIDPYGWESMWLLDMHVCERLHDLALLFVTFPMPRIARGNSKQLFKAQQYIGAEGVYTLDHVKLWLERQLAKDCFKIEHQDVRVIDNMWRVGMMVRRHKLQDFITGQVV